MNWQRQINSYLEELKIPFDAPDCPEDWKDWYHYLLFDPATGIRILINICFSGLPNNGNITVTFLLNLPAGIEGTKRLETYGFMDIHPWEEGVLSPFPLQLSLSSVDFQLSQKEAKLTLDHPASGIQFSMTGVNCTTPLVVSEPFPYGSGFIGWGLMPGVMTNGSCQWGNRHLTISEQWYCYHDHNYGRFRWGDDVGWVWWVAVAHSPENKRIVYVFHRSNNSDFSQVGAPYLFIYEDNRLIKVFLGSTLQLEFHWKDGVERLGILPGSMASLFGDRKVQVLQSISIYGKDDADELELNMQVNGAAELILPDNSRRQYTFLKEYTGPTRSSHFINGRKFKEIKGFFYGEYVH